MSTLISSKFHHSLARASFYGLKRAHLAHDNCKFPLAWQSKDYLYIGGHMSLNGNACSDQCVTYIYWPPTQYVDYERINEQITGVLLYTHTMSRSTLKYLHLRLKWIFYGNGHIVLDNVHLLERSMSNAIWGLNQV